MLPVAVSVAKKRIVRVMARRLEDRDTTALARTSDACTCSIQLGGPRAVVDQVHRASSRLRASGHWALMRARASPLAVAVTLDQALGVVAPVASPPARTLRWSEPLQIHFHPSSGHSIQHQAWGAPANCARACSSGCATKVVHPSAQARAVRLDRPNTMRPRAARNQGLHVSGPARPASPL